MQASRCRLHKRRRGRAVWTAVDCFPRQRATACLCLRLFSDSTISHSQGEIFIPRSVARSLARSSLSTQTTPPPAYIALGFVDPGSTCLPAGLLRRTTRADGLPKPEIAPGSIVSQSMHVSERVTIGCIFYHFPPT